MVLQVDYHLREIFSYIDSKKDLGNLSLVSKQWQKISRECYERLYYEEFGLLIEKVTDWKKKYMDEHCFFRLIRKLDSSAPPVLYFDEEKKLVQSSRSLFESVEFLSGKLWNQTTQCCHSLAKSWADSAVEWASEQYDDHQKIKRIFKRLVYRDTLLNRFQKLLSTHDTTLRNRNYSWWHFPPWLKSVIYKDESFPFNYSLIHKQRHRLIKAYEILMKQEIEVGDATIRVEGHDLACKIFSKWSTSLLAGTPIFQKRIKLLLRRSDNQHVVGQMTMRRQSNGFIRTYSLGGGGNYIFPNTCKHAGNHHLDILNLHTIPNCSVVEVMAQVAIEVLLQYPQACLRLRNNGLYYPNVWWNTGFRWGVHVIDDELFKNSFSDEEKPHYLDVSLTIKSANILLEGNETWEERVKRASYLKKTIPRL